MLKSYFKDIYDLLSNEHPNKKIYIISDHHFYHSNIIPYSRKNFNNVEEMNEYILNKHNEVVTNEDIIIFLGDFCFKNSAIKDILNKMNGYKYLIMGNHDQDKIIKSYKNLGLENIFINPVKINDSYLSHYPLNSEDDKINYQLFYQEFLKNSGINYHGHIHTTDTPQEPFINVSLEAQNYKPLFIGYTKTLDQKESLFINTQDFNKALNYLKEHKNIDPTLLISDYIYTFILENSKSYNDIFYAYGSFPLYKKYGLITNFSDLDIGLIYDKNLSNKKNKDNLKALTDLIYNKLMEINNIHSAFYKRISNLCIFKLIYTNGFGNYYKGFFDANLVNCDIYRDSDFIHTSINTAIEKLLKKEKHHILNNYQLPSATVKFLNINGDIANLLLQLFYQKSNNQEILLRKLNYVFKTHGIKDINNTLELENTLIRFFIRNILFFRTMNRDKDITSIKEQKDSFKNYINELPIYLQLQLQEILENPYSNYNRVFNELTTINKEDITSEANKLVREFK